MSEILMRDLSHAGHELGRARVGGLPPVVTLGEVLRARVARDVARYNAAPGTVFEGLVQPADSVRHRDGHHLRDPHPLDAASLLAAAEEAVARGILWLVVDGEAIADLSREIDVEQEAEIIAELRRPVVAATS